MSGTDRGKERSKAMPRRISPEREREYAELRAYLDFVATHIMGIDPSASHHPTNTGERIVEQFGMSRALEGLKQAVHDTVEGLGHGSLEEVRRLDEALRARNIVTFSEVRRRYATSYKRILKRGRITNETEYYLIAGILADTSSGVNEDERNVLARFAAAFEERS